MKSSFLSLVFFLALFHAVPAQELTAWPQDTLDMANTAKAATYLTPEEKKLIQLINLARLNGKSFHERIVKPYIKKNALDMDQYLESLAVDLRASKGLHLLDPLPKLHESAAFHAHDTGHKGLFGHESSDGTDHITRIHRYHKRDKTVESLCYGYNNAVDIIMQLLEDEGIVEKTNRLHILAKDLHHVGVSIKPHTVYDHNCVIDYSSL
jgi:uncharacterized protein YkwD